MDPSFANAGIDVVLVLIEALPDGVLVADAADTVVAANTEAARLLRARGTSLRGRRVDDLIPDALAGAEAPLEQTDPARVLASGRELTAYCCDGRALPVRAGVGAIRTDRGPRRLVCFKDASDRRHTEQASAEANERFTFALDASDTGVWEWVPATNAMYWSATCLRVMGVERFAGTFTASLAPIHREDVADVQAAFAKALADHAPFAHEWRIVQTDGAERRIVARARWKRERDGVDRLIGIVQEITADRHAETVVRDDSYRRLVELSPDTIFISSNDRVTYVNPAGLELVGATSADQVIGRSPYDFLHPEFRPLARERLAQLLSRGGTAPLLEQKAIGLDGREVPVETAAAAIVFDGVPSVQVIVRDITSRKRAESELSEGNQRLRELVDSLPQHVWMTDPTGKMVFLNRRLLDYTGLSADHAADWIRVIHPDDREACSAAWDQARATGAPSEIGARLRQHDGTYRWFDTRSLPLHDAEGRITGWLGSNTDVHDLRELGEALARDEARTQQLWSAAPGVICGYREHPDGTTSLPFASDRVEDIYGFPHAALVGDMSAVWARVHQDDVERVRVGLAQSAANLTTWHDEYRYRHPSDRDVWIEACATPIREADGSVLWYGFLLDVTERKLADEALRTSRAQLIAALNAGAMGSFAWDLVSGRFTGDAAVLALWGIETDDIEVSWEMIEERVHPDDRPRVREQIATLMNGGPNDLDEYRVLHPDGTVAWLATYAVVERDPEGMPVKLAGVHVDVTERKRTEDILLRSQKLEALGTLAGGIAHDFNNMLAAIHGNAELATRALPQGHPAADSIAEIEHASQRAAALVRRILSFGRPQDLERKVVALAPVLEEALRLLRATLPATVDIRRGVASDLPPVSIDAMQVHQVIVNLATNASHAIGARAGRIELQLDAVDLDPRETMPHPRLTPGGWVRLSVSDDGDGMDAATLERIFDPFFTTKPAGEGSGLGLSVVHGIMQSHGGVITVRSEPGVGSTFELWFPAAHAPVGLEEIEPALEAVARGRGRVLYVDDEPAIVRLAARALEGLGYEVVGCSDPSRAWSVFREEPAAFDLVVTDAAMPGIAGLDLAKDLLALRHDIPILMTSGHVRPEDELSARAAGVREVLQKPFSIRELGRALIRMRSQTT